MKLTSKKHLKNTKLPTAGSSSYGTTGLRRIGPLTPKDFVPITIKAKRPKPKK